MTQFQQLPQNDAQLFQYWQQSQFQEWKRNRFARNEESSSGSGWKWVFLVALFTIVGIVAFLWVRGRKKVEAKLNLNQVQDSPEELVEPPKSRGLNGKKVKTFSKLQQHQQFRDASMAEMQTQSVDEFIAWLISIGFEKGEDNSYISQKHGAEVSIGNQGIDIYTGDSQEPVFRAFTEIQDISFRDQFLKLIES